MIVFDLKCGAGHVFEAWFGSSAHYEDQRAADRIACPICGDGTIDKAVMAPNVAAKGNRVAMAAAAKPSLDPATMKTMMAKLAKAQAKALESSTWVGGAFANQARAMHEGEIDHAPIHGEASRAEAKALAEDGVPIAPLPFPVLPPNARN